MSILIKKALLNGELKDIFIDGNTIQQISDSISIEADHKIYAKGMAALPSFFNCHTHAAMTLFRSYGSDLPLQQWLETKIWPAEAKMTKEQVYAGARLGILEMIKSGTTFFNDMYWHLDTTAKAAEEMGIRASLSQVYLDLFDPEKTAEQVRLAKRQHSESKDWPQRLIFSLGPHAIYTCSEEFLKFCSEFSEKHKVPVHFHLSETRQEVSDCMEKHNARPVEYLEKIGFLHDKLICAHSVWLSDKEIMILKRNEVKVVHNPVSNMKLAVGNVFPYPKFKEAKVKVALGTDGCSSNNNLSMIEEMKFASLLQKHENGAEAMPASEIFRIATRSGAEAFGLNSGVIERGALADLILVNLKDNFLVPNNDLKANLVYSAVPSCVDTTICDGKILMLNRKIEGEYDIILKAEEAVKGLLG